MSLSDDNTTRCTRLTMTFLDSDGTVRIIEIPEGNDIRVTVEEIRTDPIEIDFMAVPSSELSALSDQGVKVIVEARRGNRYEARSEDCILRIYG